MNPAGLKTVFTPAPGLVSRWQRPTGLRYADWTDKVRIIFLRRVSTAREVGQLKECGSPKAAHCCVYHPAQLRPLAKRITTATAY